MDIRMLAWRVVSVVFISYMVFFDVSSAYGLSSVWEDCVSQRPQFLLPHVDNNCNNEYLNKYRESPSLLKNMDEVPRAMMPIELPDIFTNPPKPIPAASIKFVEFMLFL